MSQVISGIQSSTAALEAERMRLDVISENIAKAHSTRNQDGMPFQRKVVAFEPALQQALKDQTFTPTLQVGRIEKESRPTIRVYEPGHPDADAKGMVAMPAINLHEEMADMISASRAFEANLAVIKNAHSMALQTVSIGKH
jgi:flagellar basal-body rod protein FlgC